MKVLKFILAIITCCLFTVLPAALLRHKYEIPLVNESIAIIIITAIVVVISIILTIISLSKNNIDVRVMAGELENTYKYAKERYQHFFKKMKLFSFLIKLYILVVCILCFLASMALIYLSEDGSLGFLVFVIYLIPFSAFINLFSKKLLIDKKNILSKEKYPDIYKICNDIALKMNIDWKIIILYSTENTFSISSDNNIIYLTIGASQLKLLNKKELEAIIIHEFAHVLHDDTKKRMKNYKLKAYLNMLGENKSIIDYLSYGFFYWITKKYNILNDKFELSTTLNAEVLADEEVYKLGLGEYFIKGVAKGNCFNFYENRLPTFSIFSYEQMPKNSYMLYLDSFFEAYKIHQEKWLKMCYSAIQIRFPTHPTLKERMEKCDVTEITLDFNQEEELKNEHDRIILDYDLLFYEESKNKSFEDFNEYRKNEYLFYFNKCEEYNALEDKNNLYDNEFAMYGCAFIRTFKFAEALDLFSNALSLNENNYLSAFYKGLILLDRYDDSGIELLKKASLSKEFISAIERIGFYLVSNGYEEKRKELREWQFNVIQERLDIERFKKRKMPIIAPYIHPLDLEIISKVADKHKCIKSIHAIGRKSKKKVLTFVGIRFYHDSKEEDKEKATESFYYLLTNAPSKEEFEVFVLGINQFVDKMFNKKSKDIYTRTLENNLSKVFNDIN